MPSFRNGFKGKPLLTKQRRFRERLSAYRASKGTRPRRQIPRVAVPSFFTLMNLLCGFGAIIQIHEGRFDLAGWLIVFAGFFDALDGMMARLTNATSLFGIELDSLSDIVSFGVAPGFLVYVYGLEKFGLLGLIVSALPALCGAVRLARFNISVDTEGDKPEYFSGLPIPIQAAAIVAIILNIHDAAWLNRFNFSTVSLLIPIVAALAGLMVSTIPFDALPKPTLRYIRRHPYKTGACALGLLLTIFFQQVGLLIAIVLYLLFGLVHAGIRVFRAIMNTPTEPAAPNEEFT
jgi:CDP-diacylglycerol--serine O-phosphatidyltransferase